MLANGRPGMVARAVRSFRAQTFDPTRRLLLVFDSGQLRLVQRGSDSENEYWAQSWISARSIGALRNAANELSAGCDIICHWDSDDWSHPHRIEEQVALLRASDKECVGYRTMLFYDQTPGHFYGAWLYTETRPTYALGTSLCYWRKAWENRPFPDLHTGEDTEWLRGVDVLGVDCRAEFSPKYSVPFGRSAEPRMIATIHGANVSSHVPTKQDLEHGVTEWSRVPEWDEHCCAVLQK